MKIRTEISRGSISVECQTLSNRNHCNSKAVKRFSFCKKREEKQLKRIPPPAFLSSLMNISRTTLKTKMQCIYVDIQKKPVRTVQKRSRSASVIKLLLQKKVRKLFSTKHIEACTSFIFVRFLMETSLLYSAMF